MKRACLITVLAACALTKRSTPVQIHYYAVETSHVATPMETIGKCDHRMRIGSIEPDSHLRERIAYRVAGSELALYDTRKWTDVPDTYVRRALEYALFERRTFRQAIAGAVPTLDVDLTAFEEVRSPLGGRVQLRYRLHDDTAVFASDSITVVRAATTTDFRGVVAALGSALDEAANQLADQIVATCQRSASGSRPGITVGSVSGSTGSPGTR